jgi:hypothetical protein
VEQNMKTAWKAALGVLAFAGATVATPAAAQSFGLGFGPQGGISFSYDSGGYCDQWGCPDDFWDMPLYYGPVFWGGEWYDGPVYYRDWYGRRQFWLHGAWRFDEWRGPHPNWWREGRFGPALGENFYRNNGFHGRWDGGFGQRNDRRDFGGPDQRRDFGPRDDRQNFGQRDDRQGFGQRDDRQNSGQRDDRQQFNRQDAGGADRRNDSGPSRNDGLNYRGRAMNQPQAAPQPASQPQAPSGRGRGQQQAAPQQAAQQAAPERHDNGNGRNYDRGRDRRDNH